LLKNGWTISYAGNFTSREGGVQRITQILKKELVELGVEVFVCTTTSNENSSSSEVFKLPNVVVDSKENKVALNRFIRNNMIDVFINQSAYSRSSLNLMDAITKESVKLVNAHHNCIKCLYEHYPFIFKSNRPKWLSESIIMLKLWPLVKRLSNYK
jgi:3-dehydroquinate dehydratase